MFLNYMRLARQSDFPGEPQKLLLHKISIFNCFLLEELSFEKMLKQQELFSAVENSSHLEELFRQKLNKISEKA